MESRVTLGVVGAILLVNVTEGERKMTALNIFSIIVGSVA
jgi:hypothetical protein